jgi:NAD(P)-dependent dehydrogenase (short-subunit alcohol dehydrogenase family)
VSLDLQLANSRAFVTGGTRGIGAAVVESLRNAGARVVTTARSLPGTPTQGVHYVAADLATAEGCALAAESVLTRLGVIDIAVHVVGGSTAPAGGFAALDDAAWCTALNQNLMSAVRLDRALLPSMIAQQRGVIVHVTSIQRVLPLPESTTAYAAAKAALSTTARVFRRK